jgi:hypothetical protein
MAKYFCWSVNLFFTFILVFKKEIKIVMSKSLEPKFAKLFIRTTSKI